MLWFQQLADINGDYLLQLGQCCYNAGLPLLELPQHLIVCCLAFVVLASQEVAVGRGNILIELALCSLLVIEALIGGPFCLLLVVQQLNQPCQSCEYAGPGVRAAHGKQSALADLERVIHALEEEWDFVLYLAECFQVGVELLKEELHDLGEVLSRR